MARRRIKEIYDPAEWRLINSGFGDGPGNMAIDEAVLESISLSRSIPTLRLYGWRPRCLSLGLAQEWEIVDPERCAENGWDIVRRPTGGRAILHGDDLSISVFAPAGEPRIRGDDLESFRRISAALYGALNSLGLDPQRAKPYYQDHGPRGPASYDGPSAYEIPIGGRKLLRGDFLRREGAMLLQCTLPLAGEVGRVADALWFDWPGQRTALANRIGFRATTIEYALGQNLDFDEVVDYVVEGFARELNIDFVVEDLTEVEMSRANHIRAQKYAGDSWMKDP